MQDKGALVVLALVVLVAGAVIYARFGRAPAAPAPPAGTEAPFVELAHGERSRVTERANYLITSEDELRRLWTLISDNTMPPAVDFTRYVVIAVFAGEEPTAGYAIRVSKITDDDRRIVAVSINAPGISCLAAEVITTPYQVLRVPRTDLPWTHEDEQTVTSCL